MSGHHQLAKLVNDVKAAVDVLDGLGPEATDDIGAQLLLRDVQVAFREFCPNVPLTSDEQIDWLAKAFHNKVLKERRAHPSNYDMIVLPWEEEDDNIQESWRESIRYVLATGELPREGIA